ncbi:hypothetical protein [Flavobacterium sp. AG291]|uniref:hypothetical protein n=1 Tax=Flavobacterium sp. AG291 TaxID=2184000 RepID=UPI000E0BE843|nr:hypothetical protein [Flavobacterium sp. AG291]RDI07068.1 hypothetical protein DEU42_113168 [Flavobacterium sp. AG291]
MLLAETAYNIFLALPDGEKERLYAMMEKAKEPKTIKSTKKNKVWTVAECTDIILPLMKQRRNQRLKSNLKIV